MHKLDVGQDAWNGVVEGSTNFCVARLLKLSELKSQVWLAPELPNPVVASPPLTGAVKLNGTKSFGLSNLGCAKARAGHSRSRADKDVLTILFFYRLVC